MSGSDSMSPFLEPPGPIQTHPQLLPTIPQVQWANPNGFIPSVMAPGAPNGRLSKPEEVSILVTPLSKRPNTIPMSPNQVLRTSTTPKPKPLQMLDDPGDKYTAQQIIRQQLLNQQQANRKADQDQDLSESSDQFWLTLQDRGKANYEKLKETNVNMFDAIAEINSKAKPKLQFDQIIPSSNSEQRIMSGKNQFMIQEQLRQKQIQQRHEQSDESIQVFNPGSSGLQVVEGAVPMDDDDQLFSVGGSLVVGGGTEGPTTTKMTSPGKYEISVIFGLNAV